MMGSTRRWFGLAIMSMVCTLLLCTTYVYAGAKPKKVRLAYDGFGVGAAMAWVGKEAGLFKQYELDVEEVYIQNASSGGIQALIGVDIFLGSGNPVAPMQTIVEGAGVVFLGSHVSMEHYRFGVSPEIETIKQLKGKKIGISGLGRKSDLITRVVLRRAGLDPSKDVEMVAVGFSPQRAVALSKDLIQGAPLSSGVASEAKRLGLKVLDVKEAPMITGLLMTSRSLIRKNDEAVKRFMKGYLTAIHYYLTHREESIGIMEKYVSVAEPATLETMYDQFARQLQPLPIPNREAVQAVIDAASVVDARAKTLKPADLFDLRYLKELKASGFVENLYAEKVNL